MCTEESTENNTQQASYRSETKRMQNSQQVFTGNQLENSKEFGEVFPSLIVGDCKDSDIRLKGLEPLTPSEPSELIWQVFLTTEGSMLKGNCWKQNQELMGQEQ